MFYFAFGASVVIGCLLAFGFGAVALDEQRRPAALARYPLQLVSWMIATPFFCASVLGAFMGIGVGFEDGATGVGLGGVACAAAAAACVVAVVMCSRAARGKYAKGPRTPAVLGFAAPVIATALFGGVGGGNGVVWVVGLAGAGGAGVNGLLAIHVNQGRRAGTLPIRPNSTLPPVVPPTEIPAWPPPPQSPSSTLPAAGPPAKPSA